MKRKIRQVEELKLQIKSLNKYKLVFGDARLNRCLALADVTDSIRPVTRFMTVPEMYGFLEAIQQVNQHMKDSPVYIEPPRKNLSINRPKFQTGWFRW